MAKNNRECDHCREHFLLHVRKTSGGNPNVYVNVRDMVFPCRVPYFMSNRFGFPVARLKDCVKGTYYEIPLAEWQRKRQRGEL